MIAALMACSAAALPGTQASVDTTTNALKILLMLKVARLIKRPDRKGSRRSRFLHCAEFCTLFPDRTQMHRCVGIFPSVSTFQCAWPSREDGVPYLSTLVGILKTATIIICCSKAPIDRFARSVLFTSPHVPSSLIKFSPLLSQLQGLIYGSAVPQALVASQGAGLSAQGRRLLCGLLDGPNCGDGCPYLSSCQNGFCAGLVSGSIPCGANAGSSSSSSGNTGTTSSSGSSAGSGSGSGSSNFVTPGECHRARGIVIDSNLLGCHKMSQYYW